jgi:hypothetical protein
LIRWQGLKPDGRKFSKAGFKSQRMVDAFEYIAFYLLRIVQIIHVRQYQPRDSETRSFNSPRECVPASLLLQLKPYRIKYALQPTEGFWAAGARAELHEHLLCLAEPFWPPDS